MYVIMDLRLVVFICMWYFFNRGADLAALVREASICALRTVMMNFHKGGQPVIVNKSHFDEAFVRVKPSVQAKVKINYLLVTMKNDFLVAMKLFE